MSVVDKNGCQLRPGQLVRIDNVHDYDCEVLEVSKQEPCVYRIGYWVRLRTPLGCHFIQSYRLQVVAPQPLEWVRFLDREPTMDDCDCTGDVYARKLVGDCWQYHCHEIGSMQILDEWLSGVVDNLNFKPKAFSDIRFKGSDDVRHVEL